MTGATTDILRGMDYYPGFCDPAEAAALREWGASLTYQHMSYGPKWRERSAQPLKRGYCQFGIAYAPNGDQVPNPPPIPERLAALIERAKAKAGLNYDVQQCVMMHYPPGADVGWHVDSPRFGQALMIISLGAAADIEYRRTGTEKAEGIWHLENGSLYAMHGDARWNCEHRVLPVPGERYCLQLRDVDMGADFKKAGAAT